MENLQNINEDNLGGLNVLKFAPRYFFSSLVPTAFTFKPGLDWIRIEITSETASVDQETSEDEAGDLVTVNISAPLPKQRPEVDLLLKRYRSLPCVVWFRDQNGFEMVTGMYPGELILQETSNTGVLASDLNGYKISFKGTQTDKAYFLNP